MTHLKFKPRWKLFCGIIVPIAALGIVGLFLPETFWFDVAGQNAEGAKYGIFIIAEFFCIATLIRALIVNYKIKKIVADINALRDKVGESAYFVGGYCQMINKDDKDVIKAMEAELGPTTASVLFGATLYGVIANKKRRLFMFFDNGVYVIGNQDISREKSKPDQGKPYTNIQNLRKVIFTKGKFKDVTVTENGKGQIELTCPNENLLFTFNTKNLDITKEQLTQHLQYLYVK